MRASTDSLHAKAINTRFAECLLNDISWPARGEQNKGFFNTEWRYAEMEIEAKERAASLRERQKTKMAEALQPPPLETVERPRGPLVADAVHTPAVQPDAPAAALEVAAAEVSRRRGRGQYMASSDAAAVRRGHARSGTVMPRAGEGEAGRASSTAA